MGLSREEVDALPWWERRMYIEHMNEEFAPSDEDGEPAEPRSYRDSTPEPTFEAGPLSPEEEERVRRQHERYMKSAPVPGYGAADSSALEAAGFQVRRAE